MSLVRTPPWLREYDVAKADGPSNIRSSPRGAPRDARVAGTPLRGPSVTDCGPWIPAYAGMNGSEALRRALFRRALAQDVPELGLERGERFHQRGGIELPRDAGRQLVCGVIGKMSPVCLPIQHRAAPSQLAMQDRSAAVKVGLSMSRGARLGVACCDCATHYRLRQGRREALKAETQ